MKVPKNVSGREVLKQAEKHFGYSKTRQNGSHIRATTLLKGQHHITIPDHNPIKEGTLKGIIEDISKHVGLTKEEVLKTLFE